MLKTAVLIAGGRGSRLEEKTEDLPKPLIPVNGVPLLERILKWLVKNGVEKVVLGVAYKKEKVMEYFGNGSKFGLTIMYSEHDENGGTGDAFKIAITNALAANFIEEDNFFAMNSDQLTDLQFEGFVNFHIREKPLATILTIDLKTNYGIVEVNNQDDIVEFQEKRRVKGVLMNTGIYIFHKMIIFYLVGGNIEETTFRTLAKENKIKSFYYGGEWLTVNDKKQLSQMEKYLESE